METAVGVRLMTLIQDRDLTGTFEVVALDLRSSLAHSWRVIYISQPRFSVLRVAKTVEPTKWLRGIFKEKRRSSDQQIALGKVDSIIALSNPQSLIIITCMNPLCLFCEINLRHRKVRTTSRGV